MSTYLMTENNEFLCTRSAHTWMIKALLKPWIEREKAEREARERQEEEQERLEAGQSAAELSWGFFCNESSGHDPDYFVIPAAAFQLADAELPAVLLDKKLLAEAVKVGKQHDMTADEITEFLPQARSIIANMAQRGISAHIS